MKRRSGLNFSRRRKKFNVPLFKEIMTWVLECAIVIAIAYALVSSFGFGRQLWEMPCRIPYRARNRFLSIALSIWYARQSRAMSSFFLPNGNEKSHYYVRRVIACPGDTVQIKNGKVYINGELYKEDIVSASIEDPGVAADEVKLGDDEYFVLGDNRNSSEDSRMANIGNVKKDYIIGKAWFHFKGFGKMGLID